MSLIQSKTFTTKNIRKFIFIIFFTFLILSYKNFTYGAIITVDISQQPILLNALKISTWDKNETRVFLAEGNARIEQGGVQITANSMSLWFEEVKVDQDIEGHMDVYCEGSVSLLQEGVLQNYEQMYLRLITNAGVVADTTGVPIQNLEEEQKTVSYLRGKKIRDEDRSEFASKDVPQAIASTSVATTTGEIIDIFADDMDTWVEKDRRIVVATGNVRIKRGNETLNAENVILYFDQEEDEDSETSKLVYKEFYAEGNVTLKRENDLTIADKIFEDIKEEKGIFINSSIMNILKPPVVRADTPVYIKGEEIKHRGKGLYEVENGTYSLCSFGHPHFCFKSSKLRIIKTKEQSIAIAQKNVFYIGNVPIFYLPNLFFDLERGEPFLKDWEMGRSSRFGQYVKTDWNVYSVAFGKKMDDWSNMTLNMDYLYDRGPAVGLDFEYARSGYSGLMKTYFIRDKSDFDINSVLVEDEERGHFVWRHRQFLPKGWRVDIEVSDVSDRSFFREFYYNEFKMEKDRETMLYLRKVYDNKAITFLAEKQLRSYDTLVDSRRLNRTNETVPELKYKIIGEPLWGGRLNFTSESELAYHDRVFDWISSKKAESRFLGRGALLTAERVFSRMSARYKPEETIRFDTDNMLNAPFHFLGVRFNPYVGIRLSAYSESIKENATTMENRGNGSPRGRLVSAFGLNTSTTLSRTYNVYNKFLNINRIRHIMTPEIRFNFIPVVTQDPEDLNQFDRIDSLDTYQAVSIGIRNRFQTKRGETGEEIPIDFFDFDVDFNFFPGNAGLNRQLDEYVGIDFRVKVTDKISFLSERNEFNLRRGGVDVVNVGVNYNDLPRWYLYFGNRFIDDYSSSVIFSTIFSLSEKWRVSFLEQYDFKARQRDEAGRGNYTESQNLTTSIILSRYFHDWIGTITVGVDDVRSDTVTRFDIIPRGLISKKNRLRSVVSALQMSEPY